MHSSLTASVLVCSLLLVSGCGESTETIRVTTVPEPRPQIVLPEADQLSLRPFTWLIITADNFEEKIQELIATGKSPVLFALTSEGYEALALNQSDLRTFIQQQNTIIAAYKEYINE